MTTQEEKEIIEKLKAQSANVRPSRALLTSILAQLSSPASRKQWEQYFSWLRIAIPAGVALLIGIVFFNMQKDPAQVAQVPIEQTSLPQPGEVLSMVSLGAEEEAMEQVFAQQKGFFEDALPIAEEKPVALEPEASKSSSLELRKDTVLGQIELFEQRVLETAASRAVLIQESLAEFASTGASVEELETSLADAQTKINEASATLQALKANVRSKEIDETAIHDVRDTLDKASQTRREVYKIFRSIARETKNL